ncbi:MAG: beta-galactosidase [Phycisphaerae bacterium]
MKSPVELPRRDVLKFMLLSSAAGLSAPGVTPSASAAELPTGRPFSHPHRVRYDGQSLFVENKPFFLYSGCFHYYRCPKPMWRARFEKIKEAGFNTVQTYVPWNMCEKEPPSSLSDFSHVDLTDLDDWLHMATEEFGLYVTIRPGPYICAEWDTGCFPQWLLTHKPSGYRGEWLRSDNPVFMAWSRHWYDAVCPVIARHQLTRKPVGRHGVFLFQVENEYDFTSFPLEVKRRYVESLVDGALQNGINVPLFINWGSCVLQARNSLLRRVFDTMDFYPRADVNSVQGSIDAMRRSQPDAPLMTAELQGGWFTSVNSVPDLRTNEDHYGRGIGPEQINNLTLFCMQNGVTMINYYMLFGGTNFGPRPALGIATSYDYSAPIRENGGIGAKYLRVKALAAMLRDHGPEIARSQAIKVSASVEHADVSVAAREAPGGGLYVFVRKIRDGRPRSGRAKITAGRLQAVEFRYSLEKFGSKILYFPPGISSAAQARWLPEKQPAIRRPGGVLPSAVEITHCRTAVDPTPTQWRAVKQGQSLVDLGYYLSGFNYYRARLSLEPLPGHVSGAALMARVATNDTASAMLDGHVLYNSGTGNCVFTPKSPLAPGRHDAMLVYENRGHLNGGMPMEELYGIFELAFKPTEVAGRMLEHWQMKHIQPPRKPASVRWARRDVSTAGWQQTFCRDAESATQLSPNSWAVFRHRLTLTTREIESHLTELMFTRIDDKGWIFVNGKLIGTADSWSRPWTFNAAGALKPGENSIAVLVQNVGGPGGLGLVKLVSANAPRPISHLDGPMEIASAPVGVEHRWNTPDFDDSSWHSHLLPQRYDASIQPHLLSWHRMEFHLPPVRPDVWLPWCLKIQAVGTGFIYLNGHNYGRFWQDGGQREYYLPECWLKPHEKGKNVIALCLRAVDKPAQILSASIVPYRIYAEPRRCCMVMPGA